MLVLVYLAFNRRLFLAPSYNVPPPPLAPFPLVPVFFNNTSHTQCAFAPMSISDSQCSRK